MRKKAGIIGMNFNLPERYATSESDWIGDWLFPDQSRFSDRDHSLAGVMANDLFRRALRRLAAFLWIMPRLAALSMAEIIACTSFAAGFIPVPEMPFCIFRKRVRTLRLRRERTVV